MLAPANHKIKKYFYQVHNLIIRLDIYHKFPNFITFLYNKEAVPTPAAPKNIGSHTHVTF